MVIDPKKNEKFSENDDRDLKKAPLPPLPFAHQLKIEPIDAKEIERLTHKEGPLTYEEAAKLMDNLERKRKELKNKLDESFRVRGIDPDYLRSYMNNPSNFTPQEWSNLQKEREKFIKSLGFSPDSLEGSGSGYTPSSSSASKGNKERRKTAAMRRRNWLPMK
jgi:hypothetical protein